MTLSIMDVRLKSFVGTLVYSLNLLHLLRSDHLLNRLHKDLPDSLLFSEVIYICIQIDYFSGIKSNYDFCLIL